MEERSPSDGLPTLDDVGSTRRPALLETEPWQGDGRIGRFERPQPIGRGGMGQVYRAVDPARQEEVAVKVLLGFNPTSYSRFRREFRSVAELKHPNLVDLHELFFEDGRLFFSMELLSGSNFLEAVRPDGVLDIDRLEDVASQLAAGLHTLHQAGKLHRDLKPSNILVAETGRVVILDFGLVMEREGEAAAHSARREVVGTPAYMSPEQASSKAIDAASDWYTFGLLLYEALTGVRPHRAKRAAETLRRRRTEAVPPPSTIADVPSHLDGLTAALLDRDPRARPSGERVLEILGATHDPSRDETHDLFVGRRAELACLEAALQRVEHNRPVVVFIHGPSGIGKTSVVDAFLRGLDDAVTVLHGRCYERESIPFKALDDIVEQLTKRIEGDLRLRDYIESHDMGALEMLFPAIARLAAPHPGPQLGPASPDLREAAFEALAGLLLEVGALGPIVLAIEDLQWSDDDSVPLLRKLLLPPNAAPMLLVATHRDAPEADSVHGADRSVPLALRREIDGCEVIELALEPLAETDASRLARGIVKGATPELVADLVRESQGSPMFLVELARQAGDHGHHRPMSLDDSLGIRVAALDSAARALLTAIAVAGGRIEQGAVLDAAGRIDPTAVIARGALDELRRERLVRTIGVTDDAFVETYHDRVRSSVIRRLTPSERRAAHAALAQALAARGTADPAALATHFAAAGKRHETIEASLRAADRAMSALAFQRAARWLELARSNLEGRDDRRYATERRLGEAWSCAGHGAEAAAAYVRASELAPDSHARNDLRRLAAHALVNAGNLVEGRRMLFALMGESGIQAPTRPAAAIASLLVRRAKMQVRGLSYRQRPSALVPPEQLHRIDLCWAGSFFVNWEPILGAWFSARHLELALEAGEPSRIAPALASESVSSLVLGRVTAEEAWDQLARAEQLAVRAQSDEAIAWVSFSKPVISLLTGDWAGTVQTAERAIELLRKQQAGGGVPILSCRYFMCWALYLCGDWHGLEPRLRNLIAAGGSSNPRRRACEALLTMPFALARGEPAVVRTTFDEPARWHPNEQGPPPPAVLLFTGAIQSRLYDGRTDEAWAFARRHEDLQRRFRFRDPLSRAIHLMARIQVCIAHGDAPAIKRARRCLKELATLDFRPRESLTLLAQAGLAGVRKRAEEMVHLLRRSVDALEASGMGMHAAAAKLRLGEATGETEHGRELVESATRFMRRNGVYDPARLAAVLAPGCVRQ